jgi:uncharacterized membrane protein
MKRIVLIVVGVVLAVVGIFWLLQGLNVFNQSGGMNGNKAFDIIGPVVAIVGLILLRAGVRTRKS